MSETLTLPWTNDGITLPLPEQWQVLGRLEPSPQSGLPFVEFVDSPEEAVRRAQRQFPAQAGVLAFPHGGTTYPILGE